MLMALWHWPQLTNKKCESSVDLSRGRGLKEEEPKAASGVPGGCTKHEEPPGRRAWEQLRTGHTYIGQVPCPPGLAHCTVIAHMALKNGRDVLRLGEPGSQQLFSRHILSYLECPR